MSQKQQRLPSGFGAFIGTESLGAFNDNFFKTLVQLYVVNLAIGVDSEKILSLSTAVFTIPFVLFGPWSGYISDRFSKKHVMQIIKAIEILIMAIGFSSFALQSINGMLIVVFLLAAHSTFFAPAKAGFIPETCAAENITRANGLVGLTTFVSIILGTAIAGLLLDAHHQNPTTTSLYGVALACVGLAVSFKMTPTPPTLTKSFFPLNPFAAMFKDLKSLASQRGLFNAALANSYFWLLGLIFQTNIMRYGKAVLGLGEEQNTRLSVLPAFIGLGIGAGSMLASRWSGKKVEIGLVPLGGIGLCLIGLMLGLSFTSYNATLVLLLLAGICGGIFYIPLQAYLQTEAAPGERGRVIATAGILNGFFMVLGSALFYLFTVTFKLTPSQIFLVMSGITILVTIYICTIIPEYFVRFIGWLITHTFYDIRIVGQENVPAQGPALLAANHVSFIDALLVGATIQRFIKFIMYKKIYEIVVVKWFCGLMDVIPIAPYEGRASVAISLDAARERLKQGEIVCIFPEGGITRDGVLHEFKGGMESIMQGMDCPIIPVHLKNVWGSIFSFESGRAFWKLPKKFPYPVTIIFGKPLPPHSTKEEVQIAVANLDKLAD